MGQGSGIALSCDAGHRCGSDLVLLWLWRRLAATAPIGPLAWEPLYASGDTLKKTKKKTYPDSAILAVAVFCGKQLPGSDLKLSLSWDPWDESLSGDTGREGEGDRMQRQQRWT